MPVVLVIIQNEVDLREGQVQVQGQVSGEGQGQKQGRLKRERQETGLPPAPNAPQGKGSSPHVSGQVAQLRTRKSTFIQQYINSEVIFDISRLNSKLKNALIFSFKTASCREQKYTVMCHLKPQSSKKEKAYRHALTTAEAMALHQHVFTKHRGREDVDRQLEEIVQVLEKYKVESREVPHLPAEREKHNQKVAELM